MSGARNDEQGTGRPDARPAPLPSTDLPPRIGKALKWIGAVTTVLGLVFGLVQANRLLTERAERGRAVREHVATARLQLEGGEHAAAWSSALSAAEVDARDTTVRRLQEDVAMAWLRGAAIAGSGAPGTGPRSFSALAEPLVPVLDRGVLETSGARKGDLLAHRGWADFLRGRDGAPQAVDPARWYAMALAADSANPYAHAMWGHWTQWSGGGLAAVRAHFDAAAATGREHGYVRTLQLAALRNERSPGADAELLRLANAMRSAGAQPDAELRRMLDRAYDQRMGDSTGRAALLAALPPDVHLATYRWLFADELRDAAPPREPKWLLRLAQLQANAGDQAGALATFRALASLPVEWRPGERRILDAALGGSGRRP